MVTVSLFFLTVLSVSCRGGTSPAYERVDVLAQTRTGRHPHLTFLPVTLTISCVDEHESALSFLVSVHRFLIQLRLCSLLQDLQRAEEYFIDNLLEQTDILMADKLTAHVHHTQNIVAESRESVA